jgi:D-3-phosphoglycerate dehydrogenase
MPTKKQNLKSVSLNKNKIKILLLEGLHQNALDNFAKAGYTNIESLKTSLAPEDLKKKIASAHIIGIRSRTQLTDDILASAEKLMAIGCFCIGTNQVDKTAALKAGVPVFNAPYSNTRSVAELVLAEIIMLFRGIPEKNATAHKGGWLKSASNSFEIRGKTLGLIGYGNIGTQLGILAESLGMKVIFHDLETRLPLGNSEPAKDLNDLLSKSDVVSLHVPETSSTKNMIGATQIKRMKKNSILINASRGTVIDIDALADALESKYLLGAAIDVFPTEPKSNDDIFESPLQKFDNVILTPHIGGSTLEAQENIGLEVSEKLIKYSDNGTTTSSVNFPEVSVPEQKDAHRLLHIHKNIPGVLSEINDIFSSHSINISSQYLQTNEEIGYVVMDVDAEYSDIALNKLQNIQGTIKARVLF